LDCPRAYVNSDTANIRSYLSRLEKGVYYASLKIVGKLAAVPGVAPAELLKLPEKKGSAHDL
jgi:hypothetical protein